MMRKFVSVFLILALMMSFSAVAFADGSPVADDPEVIPTTPTDREEKYEGIPTTENVMIEVEGVSEDAVVEVETTESENGETVTSTITDPVTEEVVIVVKGPAAEAPAAVKEMAMDCLDKVIDQGYAIDSGFAVYVVQGEVSTVTVTIPVEDVPEDNDIFVNGTAIPRERLTINEKGEYVLQVTPPVYIIIAHK